MKLTLNVVELQTAIATFVETLGLSLEDKDVDISFKDGECHLDIGGYTPTPTEDKPLQKRKPRTKLNPKQEHEQEENTTSNDVETLVVANTAITEEEVLQDTDTPSNTDEETSPEEVEEEDSQEEQEEEEPISEEPVTKKVKDNGFSLFN